MFTFAPLLFCRSLTPKSRDGKVKREKNIKAEEEEEEKKKEKVKQDCPILSASFGCLFLTIEISFQVQPLSLEELLAKKKAAEEAEAKVRSI